MGPGLRRDDASKINRFLPRCSIRIGMIDIEIVELARRAIAPERFGVGLDLGLVEKLCELAIMLIAHFLFDAVGTKARNLTADKQLRLIDRIAKRLRRIAEHHQMARLRHE